MTGLADPHNFGRRVQKIDDCWFYKPRTIFWERLLLESTSLLRRTVDQIFSDNVVSSPFAAIPCLMFRAESTEGPGAGEVEGLFPEPLNPAEGLSPEDLNLIGSVIGFLTWLGLTDLHVQNMAIGRDAAGRLICCPLDIECLFHDLQLPSQTILIPSNLATPQTCGLASLLQMTGLISGQNAAALIDGFLGSISILVAAEPLLNRMVFDSLETVRSPIRLLVRPSAEYMAALQSGNREGFSKSEREQLDRGDVPYFFRYPTSDSVLYWSEKWTASPADLPSDDGKTRRFEFRLITRTGLEPSPGKGVRLATKAGSLQLARAFDPGLDGSWSHGSTMVTYGSQDTIIHYSGGTAWRTTRHSAQIMRRP